MKNYCTQFTGAVCFAVLLCLAGCEAHEIVPLDGKIKMVDTIYGRGLTGYSIDSVYSEFVYITNAKNVLLSGLRKGIISGNGSVEWETNDAVIRYGEGSGDIIYSYRGKLVEIILNDNYYAEDVTTHEYGRLVSKVSYGYNPAGYLSVARIERPGQTPVMVYYNYPDLQNPTGSGEIVIEEHPEAAVYRIPLATVDDNGTPKKQENDAYICNVLSYGNSSMTNEYVINPDLYYLGLYGVPFKYLPDVMIEKSVRPLSATSLVRVGNSRYYY
ncbi:MAG: hypothetical protein LBP64_04005 [Tannerella sp.]|jgi:hypothetical protein|nr:hypothetical protein [Tannerella sp.]